MWEDRPVSNRTRILFALVGALACLVTGICCELAFNRMHAEALMRRYHAASLLFITDPETTKHSVAQAAQVPDDRELQRRLDEAGAQTGDVQISLAWNNNNDLDLSCMDPNGEMIDGYNQSSRSGGVLDVDMNATDSNLLTPQADALIPPNANLRPHRTGYSSEPVENLVWAHNAPIGHYKVYVHQFCNKELVAETPFWVVVHIHGRVHRIAGVMGREDFAAQLVPPKLVYEFDVAPPSVVAATHSPPPVHAAPPPLPPRIVVHTAYSLRRFDYALLVSGLWGALIGLLPLALLYAQRIYSRQPLLSGQQDLLVGIGGPAIGLTAVLVGQATLSLLTAGIGPAAFPVLFVLSWILFGGLLGYAVSLITPNLPRVASPIAGALSAFASATLFLLLAAGHQTVAGHLLTACLMGGSIGALIALPERERRPEPEPQPEPPREITRAPFETQPPFIVRGTRTRKVGGLRQNDRGTRL